MGITRAAIPASAIPADIGEVAKRIAQARGRGLLVGGAVIDLLQGREPKDWDIEVYRLGYEDLKRIFVDMHPQTVGQSFGILKIVTPGGTEVDLSVPRRENKVGVGHQGFEVTLDPRMTPTEAARRRDFTMNSMAFDFDSLEIIDPFGGLDDLRAGILRVTDAATFVEDPLRVLRAMQLLARKAKTVDPESMRLMQSMVDTFPELPKERVYEEFRKLLLKASRPSMGLNFLLESGWIVHFPELHALVGCPQHPEWHPEGDVWTHSLLATDAMAQVRDYVPEAQREAFALGVFLHDIGKPAATITPELIAARDPRVAEVAATARMQPEEMLYTAYGHDTMGVPIAESLLRRMMDTKRTIELVQAVVGQHMQPYHLFANRGGKGAYARLHRKMASAGGDLRLIGFMCACDACASGPFWAQRSLRGGKPNWEDDVSSAIMDFAAKLDDDPGAVAPKVQGRDLIALGLKPGPAFSGILQRALELQFEDADRTREDIIAILQGESLPMPSSKTERLPARSTPPPPFAALVLIERSDGLVLGMSRRHNYEDFGLPGGKVDPGETGEEAAAREFGEEVGVPIDPSLLVQVFSMPGRSGRPVTTYVYPTIDVPVGVRAGEGQVAWVSWDRLFASSFGEYNRRLHDAL